MLFFCDIKIGGTGETLLELDAYESNVWRVSLDFDFLEAALDRLGGIASIVKD